MTKVKGVTACRVTDAPTNAPTKTDTPTNTPTDTISRAAALDEIDGFLAVDKYYHPYSQGKTIPVEEMRERLKRLPPTQPDLSSYSDKLWRSAYERGKAEAQAEIIRCKDCKHHWTHRCMDSMPTEICDLNQTFYDPNSDFCSLAERRTDGVDN